MVVLGFGLWALRSQGEDSEERCGPKAVLDRLTVSTDASLRMARPSGFD